MSRWYVTCLGCGITELVDTNSAGKDSEESFRERHKDCEVMKQLIKEQERLLEESIPEGKKFVWLK